ncbi:uncharacterized protein B0I36DRAFT_351246 [Microdochium trichocladiopsis]|uniref:Uncharacterized protein n=1 Tax=Microdochium trichocladiopsis TaxID=1682393 RepID=A0A9P9BNI0_9PEZI|nr:uncharacterized protein B0I36DRAFT_351246 [Microdochium trichocladiopsis]KAH7027758.1 hypothetical protein B0I36DRAFT_351246 [Microdochium trichocladiopsis]
MNSMQALTASIPETIKALLGAASSSGGYTSLPFFTYPGLRKRTPVPFRERECDKPEQARLYLTDPIVDEPGATVPGSSEYDALNLEHCTLYTSIFVVEEFMVAIPVEHGSVCETDEPVTGGGYVDGCSGPAAYNIGNPCPPAYSAPKPVLVPLSSCSPFGCQVMGHDCIQLTPQSFRADRREFDRLPGPRV